jgi:hypothetical protein
MSDINIQEKAGISMIAMNAAIRNLRLYPLSSSSALTAVEKAYESVLGILEHTDALSFAESEKRLLVCGQTVDEKGGKKDQIKAFLQLFLDFEIKNITLLKKVERPEFERFLEILSKSTRDMQQLGGLKKVLAGEKMPNILVDQRVYVSLDEGQQVAAKGAGGGGASQVGSIFGPMINTLDDILTSDTKGEVSRCLAESMARKDDDILANVMIQKMQGELGENFFARLMEVLDEQRFEKLLYQLRQMLDEVKKADIPEKKEEAKDIARTLQGMIRSEKGEMFQKRIKEKQNQEQQKKRKQTLQVRSGLDDILSEKAEAFKDARVMEFLPKAVGQLLTGGRQKVAERFIEKLGKGFLSKDGEIRRNVSQALTEILDNVDIALRNNLLKIISRNLTEWIRMETELPPGYEKICAYLQNAAQNQIQEGNFSECDHILKAFNFVGYYKEVKEEKSRSLARTLLRDMASENILASQVKELGSEEGDNRKNAVARLVKLGGAAVRFLLNALNNSQDRAERARLLKVISDIGPPALPSLMEDIQLGKPWYYMRNLILLFGKVGNESHVEIIEPFLKYNDPRVQRETLNAIYLIGGKKREDILITALNTGDERLKIDVVRMLGLLKSRKAVPPLLEMLDSKKIALTKTAVRLSETLCAALSQIGDVQALPALQAIADQKKGLLSRAPSEKAIHAAAARAVMVLTRKP